MKLTYRRFHHAFLTPLNGIALLAVIVFAGLVIFVPQVFAASAKTLTVQRLVTIHDGSKEITVFTKGETVGDALAQADVATSQKDIVEPAITEKLEAKTYQVNIFRARPVVIVDGATRFKVVTAEQSPRLIMKAAGLPYYDEDVTALERVDSVLSEGGAGLRLVVRRATVFNLTLYGKQFEARTQATTIEQLLKEKGVTLGVADGVSPALSAPISSGMNVRIWRNGKQTVTQEEVVTRPTEEIKDAEKTLGLREVKEVGADGKRNATYEIETKDGAEVSRKEIASVVTLAPVKQVVVVGTKVVMPAGSHTDWMAAAGISTSDYGYVEFIVSHESGWGATKSNYSGSGAYGLCQALPGSKMASAGSDWATNPITQLRWCNGYAVGWYGSWAGAYSFWIKNHWW